MRIVLAYSGGRETSAAIPWLREHYRADVIAVTLDLGQGGGLEAVRDRALAAGAVRAHVVDVREQFAREFVLRSLRADAVLEPGRPMPRALGRPLIGQALVDIARIERALAVAHGCDDTGPDRLRIESAVRGLNPGLALLAPAAEWGKSLADPATDPRGREVPRSNAAAFSVDMNLWGRSIAPAGGAVPDSAFTLTKPAAACPDEPAAVEVAFETGAPMSINGVTMPLTDLVQSLGTIAGAHGVGRIPDASTGGFMEAPAAVVLHAAHGRLRKRAWDDDLTTFARVIGRRYAEIVDRGGWFSPLRAALDGFVAASQLTVSGTVRLKLFKTTCEVE
jgi:argininosuccinate synthase